MVICIVALVVLGFLGLFSAKYRKWAREAAGCVARMATLRPCETGFDDKVKAVVTTALMSRHQGIARFTHRHFKALSWVFMLAFVFSLGYSAYSIYNLAVFGTCDPVHPDQCIFNPGGDPNRVVCPYEGLNLSESVTTIGNFSSVASAVIEGRPAVYFFGTTWCPHCRWERPIFMNVAAKFAGYIDLKVTDIDVSQPPVEMELFSHYSPEGRIPLIIIGGKYFRVGSGEVFGAAREAQVLTALLCKAANDPISDCLLPEIQQLAAEI
ncbi:MAG: thioredoxin family protein [Candidatus Aenigmarchaeota archaeon]|nr:thioredoxin family protein [Candidatus Aenigmarchaeota archaeon]